MTRPEGSRNKKPTKGDILEMLIEAGVDVSFLGKNDGAAIKKSVLEQVAAKAGIDIYGKKKAMLGKRPVVENVQYLTIKEMLGKRHVVKNVQDLTIKTSMDQTFPAASSNINVTQNQVEDSDFGEAPLNQQ